MRFITRRLQIFLLLSCTLMVLSFALLTIGHLQHRQLNQQIATQTRLQFEEHLLSFVATATQIGYQNNLANAQYLQFTDAVAALPQLEAILNIWLINTDGTYMDINNANPHQGYLATQDDTDYVSLPKYINDTSLWSSYFAGTNPKPYQLLLKRDATSFLTLVIPFTNHSDQRLLAVDLDIGQWITPIKPDQQLAVSYNNELIWSITDQSLSNALESNILNNTEFILHSDLKFNLWLYLLPIPLLTLLFFACYYFRKSKLLDRNVGKVLRDTVESLDLLILETNHQGIIIWLSQGASNSLKVFNLHEGDVLLKCLADHPRMVSDIHSSLQGESLTYQIDAAGFNFRIKQQPRLDSTEQIIGLSLIIKDISEQIAQEKQLKHQQLHDKLTSLPNRQLFEQQLDHDIHRAKRREESVAILAIEINGLGNINKTLGHQYGDLAIKHIATVLRDEIRNEDMISRFSSDEFLVICDDYHEPSELRTVAQRVIDRATAEFIINDQPLKLSANIGVATFPRDSKDSGSLISNAIAAMRHARQSGRNTLDYFSTDNAKQVQRKWQLEQALANAAKTKSFELHYQPIFDVNNGLCKGAEALIRWPDSELTPDQFIPMAEQSGLMHSIGSWVLEHALQQLQRWQKKHPKFQYMSVNLSVAQIHETNFIATVKDIVRRHPFESGSVVLELTESIMMSSTGDMQSKLTTLKEMGFKLAIDDFGTGYSSLSYLKFLPIDIIKIDRSFIDGIPQDSAHTSICEAIIQMSRAMNLSIVAEGIETTEQLAWLVSKGVSTAQGFFYARPVPADLFETFLPVTKN